MGRQEIVLWLESTPVGAFVNDYTWAWPIAESFHFIGLCLLIGTVGLFDLRLLGIGKQIPLSALHRLIPWGIFGFAINVTTGSMFLAAAPIPIPLQRIILLQGHLPHRCRHQCGRVLSGLLSQDHRPGRRRPGANRRPGDRRRFAADVGRCHVRRPPADFLSPEFQVFLKRRVIAWSQLARLSHGFSSRSVGDAVRARRVPEGRRRRT